MKLAALLILLLATPVVAAPKAKKPRVPEASENVDRDITLEVPVTELGLSTKPKVDMGPAIASFEFAASSWSPKEFTRPTYARGTTGFSSTGLPFLSLNRHAPLYLFDDFSGFHSKLGLSFGRLERKGQFTAGSSFLTTQTLNLISVRAGAEYQSPRVLREVIGGYAGFSLLPTLALSAGSQLEGSVSKLGLPMEAVAGVIAYPGFLKEFLGMRNGAIGVGAHYIFGTVDNSRMNDLGAQGFLRLDI